MRPIFCSLFLSLPVMAGHDGESYQLYKSKASIAAELSAAVI
jgi:hypothetical protein